MAFLHDNEDNEFDNHVYTPLNMKLTLDLADQGTIPKKFAVAIDNIDNIIAELPEEWHPEYDADKFFDSIKSSVTRINAPDFWRNL